MFILHFFSTAIVISLVDKIPGGGGYLGFQGTGMIEGFVLGLKFSIPVFFGKENLASIFLGGLIEARDFLG